MMWYCFINGRQYGPMSEEALRAWISEGRVGPTSHVWREGMAGWQPAQIALPHLFLGGGPAGPPAPPAAPLTVLRPHRGTAVLVLGIVGFVCCICGIIAWAMGRIDLKEMDSGRMDPAGRGNTRAGKICGMISVIIFIAKLAIMLIFLLVGVFEESASHSHWSN